MRRSLRGLQREGFRHVFVLRSPEEVEAAEVERQPRWNNLKHERGPFDIIGDVHGCCDELVALLTKLGYEAGAGPDFTVRAPLGRKAVFLGDLVDRGPKITTMLRLVMKMVADGPAFCVPGNKEQASAFFDDLVSHYVLDEGKLVVAHAGMKEEMQGRGSGKVLDL
jgi:protein phosphatase